MPLKVIRKLLHSAKNEPIMNMEDVYVTGILRENLGVDLRLFPGFTRTKIGPICSLDLSQYRTLVTSLSAEEMFQIHKILPNFRQVGSSFC
jgi:hypothetical protein